MTSSSSSSRDGAYSTLDLTLLGIGGTVGSGIFVTTSLVARSYAGPAVVLSWLIAGIAASLSALSYCELSYIGSSGSSYEYAKILRGGKYFATIAAWCLTLEYGISGAAVARSWGDKVLAYLRMQKVELPRILFDPRFPTINVLAFLLQFYCMLLLLHGVDIGKYTTNAFTILKIVLIIFIIILGLYYFNYDNILSNGVIPYGAGGVVKGSSLSFFGYVGFDEICSFASEAKRPDQLHLSLMLTVASVTFLCILASVALVGMQEYTEISIESGFPSAFKANGNDWAFHLVALGEIVSLPVVTLCSFLAQPRLLCQLAKDGLLPKIFAQTDNRGNLSHSIFITGTLLSLAALIVPFSYLNDMISSGILVSFTITNCSLIVHRLGVECRATLARFVAVSVLFAALIAAMINSTGDYVIHFSILMAPISCLLGYLAYQLQCSFRELPHDGSAKRPYFIVPFAPAVPLLGCVINAILCAQLPLVANVSAVVYFAAASLCHFTLSVGLGNGDSGDSVDRDGQRYETDRRYATVDTIVEMVEVSLSPLQNRDNNEQR